MPYPDERCKDCTIIHNCNFNSIFVFSPIDTQELFIPPTCPLGTKTANEAVEQVLEKRKHQNTVKVIRLK